MIDTWILGIVNCDSHTQSCLKDVQKLSTFLLKKSRVLRLTTSTGIGEHLIAHYLNRGFFLLPIVIM